MYNDVSQLKKELILKFQYEKVYTTLTCVTISNREKALGKSKSDSSLITIAHVIFWKSLWSMKNFLCNIILLK